MATRPAVAFTWDGAQYAEYGPRWDQAVAHCRQLLRGWAKQRYAGTYTEVSNVITEIDWPQGPFTHDGSQMGLMLGQVSLDELDSGEDRPLLSALVFAKEDNLPSHGFWKFLDQLGVSVAPSEPARVAFWSREVERCFDFFGKPG